MISAMETKTVNRAVPARQSGRPAACVLPGFRRFVLCAQGLKG
jgi:hypothetical protein